MDSVDCGPGVDRVILNSGDLHFNCEHYTRLRGLAVPGTMRTGDDQPNQMDDWNWNNRDLLVGLGGDDFLRAHGSADMLWGNEGNDYVDGDLSPDHVLGGPGDDWLFGGYGLDRLWGGAGLDHFDGGFGDDELISITADGVADVLDCGPGRDRAIVRTGDSVARCERVIRIRG
jgi:Ca2+-binding RTX toxin-like protein